MDLADRPIPLQCCLRLPVCIRVSPRRRRLDPNSAQRDPLIGGGKLILAKTPWFVLTHSMRRTKATLIYQRTKNLRAVQRLFANSKLESTVRYLGLEVDDALQISEQTEI